MVLPNGYRFPDVSKYRTVCNWNEYSGAYPVSACKKSEGGTYQDPSFAAWLTNMRREMRFPILYHFLRAEYSIADQVENYLRGLDGKPFGVMLDVETSGVRTNPTMDQVNAWLNECSRRTGVPRSKMLMYMPRWWYQSFGQGRQISDVLLWGSHYSTSPNISPYAGNTVDIIQYSSTAPIAGVCSPGTGDMNVAINMTPQDLIERITVGTLPPSPPEDDDMLYIITYAAPNKPPRCFVDGALVGFPNVEEMTEYVKAFTNAGYVRKTVTFAEADDWQRHMDGYFSQFDILNKRLTIIENKIETPAPVDVDEVALAAALKPIVEKAVDAELDQIAD